METKVAVLPPRGLVVDQACPWHLLGPPAAHAVSQPRVAAATTARPPDAVRLRLRRPAMLEADTVAYDPQGAPEAAIASALTPAGERVLVRSSDEQLIAGLLADAPLGGELMIEGEDELSW